MEKKRILIIDDEATFTRMVRLNLEKTGKYEVREENRGRRGAAAAREFKPHLIFLDVIMPDADGGEVAAHIQADNRLKDVPIVFLTATVSKREVGDTGGTRGGLFFLAKPVTLEQLEACIARHIPEVAAVPENAVNPPPAGPQEGTAPGTAV
ncbi:MAG: response regulator [Verrucomicrobiae bacterium]|nr:response regulator [Verrucomicrobiae bacterium]